MIESKAVKLMVSLSSCQLVGIIGGLIGRNSVQSWYTTIEKPNFTPPNWIFGPVWFALYLSMGFALYLVWDSNVGTIKNTALILFGIQLLLNMAWSVFFFYFRSPLYGFTTIVVLLIAVIWTGWVFFKIRPLSGYLMIPYLLWLLFALALNYSIWRMNR